MFTVSSPSRLKQSEKFSRHLSPAAAGVPVVGRDLADVDVDQIILF